MIWHCKMFDIDWKMLSQAPFLEYPVPSYRLKISHPNRLQFQTLLLMSIWWEFTSEPLQSKGLLMQQRVVIWFGYNVHLVTITIVSNKTLLITTQQNLPHSPLSHVTQNRAHISLKTIAVVGNQVSANMNTLISASHIPMENWQSILLILVMMLMLHFQKLIFGCGHNNSLMRKDIQKTSGLVTQLGYSIGHKFSYCLVPFHSNTTSKIKFRSESTISGNGVLSTPLIIKSPLPLYYLNLEGITIGK